MSKLLKNGSTWTSRLTAMKRSVFFWTRWHQKRVRQRELERELLLEQVTLLVQGQLLQALSPLASALHRQDLLLVERTPPLEPQLQDLRELLLEILQQGHQSPLSQLLPPSR